MRTPPSSDSPRAGPALRRRTRNSLLPLFRQIFNAFGLHSSARWSLPPNVSMMLMHLYARPGREPAEPAALAGVLHLPRQTVTFVLDALERRGWAARRPHPTDRRRKTIRLTPAGRRLAARMVDTLFRVETAALKGVTVRERRVFGSIMTRYVAALTGAVSPAAEKAKGVRAP